MRLARAGAVVLLLVAGVSPLAAVSTPSGGATVVVLFEETVEDEALDGIPGQVVARGSRVPHAIVRTDAPSHVIRSLQERPSVAHAYRPGPAHLLHDDRFVPDDPRYDDQWGPDAVGLESAWAHGRGRRDVRVAVLDEGIFSGHPDLKGRTCSVVGGGTGSEHGTRVAGILAAGLDNGIGVAGTSRACLVDIPVAGDAGPSFNDFGDPGELLSGDLFESFQIAMGILEALARDVDVISMSLGTIDTPFLEAAVDAAWEADVPMVAAAGNSGVEEHPAAYTRVISVSALADPSRIKSNSAVGDIAAPGAGILTTSVDIPAGMSLPSTYNYERAGQTSMATPFVSGTVALLLSRAPCLTNGDVVNVLRATSDPISSSPVDRLDASGAVHAVLDGPQPVEVLHDPVEVESCRPSPPGLP